MRFAGTRQEAAERTALEQRLLDLWRDGRLAWKNGSPPESLGIDLDSEVNVVKAWEWRLIGLLED